jgi:phage/plasmid primase-like uncharacterized protein
MHNINKSKKVNFFERHVAAGAPERTAIVLRFPVEARESIWHDREHQYTRDGQGAGYTPHEGEKGTSGQDAPGNSLTTLTVEELFQAFIESKLEFAPEDIIADGKIHRFGEAGDDGKKPGWYVLHADDLIPYGIFNDFRRGEKSFHWQGQSARPLTPEERAEYEKRRTQRATERNNEVIKAQKRAAQKAKKICEENQYNRPNADFEYFVKKNVGIHGFIIQTDSNEIAIPIREDGDKITSLQYIMASGSKLYLFEGKIKGCWFQIGDLSEMPESPIVIGEGYATCATINETTGLPVAVAFDAGNLEPVAKKIAEKYPGRLIVIAGDDDLKRVIEGKGNPGVEKANAAAKAVNGVVALPPFDRARDGVEHSDWNDLAALRGKDKITDIFLLTVEEAKKHRPEPDDVPPQPPGDIPPPPPGNQIPPPPPGVPYKKSSIQISTDLDIDLRACAKALINSPHVEIFQRGGSLVMRGIVKAKIHTGEEINDDAIIAHCTESLRVALAVAANFTRIGRKGESVKCYPPNELAAALVKCTPLIGRFPVLRGLTSIPTIRADGSILDKPGYDPMTGLYYDPKGIDFGAMPQSPSMEDAIAALEELKALICKFPFVSEASRSVALARLLTGVARNAMKAAIMFLYDAPSPRTGKSKLNDIGSMITCGHEAPVISATSSPEEREKQLVAALRGGTQTITLDNLPNGEALESELICQMLTQERVEVRAFHSNDKLIILPNIATVVANGNNIGVSADMTERTNLCQLDAKMEFPGSRKFDFDPVEMVRADRPKYVRACLIILRAHALAGYPMSEELSALGGFEEWSKIVRAALVWLGCDDPCETMNIIRAEDPKRGSLVAIMEHFESDFGKGPKTVAEVIKHAEKKARDVFEEKDGVRRKIEEGDGAFLSALTEVASLEKGGHVSAKSLGRWFKAYEGVMINGRRFFAQSHGKHKGAKLYYLLSAEDKEPTAHAESDDDVGM